MTIREELAALADPTYKEFQEKLIPTVDASRVLGVRMPVLRSFAASLARERPAKARAFMATPAHGLYDEMNLHGMLIGLLAQTPGEAFEMLEAFLPHVDNWATCDLIRVPAFKDDLPAVYGRICSWVGAEPEYLVRFGIVQLMELFSDGSFESEHLALVAGIERPEYYINMARAWYFSIALVKHYDETIGLFEKPVLDPWTHDKALQKARESRRVSPERKTYLQSLKSGTRRQRRS